MSSHAVSERDEFSLTTGSEPHYVEGYVPSSLDSQHSSLNRTSTWCGAGLLLTSVTGIGTMMFGLGSYTVGSQENWALITIIGAIMLAFCWIVGGLLIYKGRTEYRAYRSRTGRVH